MAEARSVGASKKATVEEWPWNADASSAAVLDQVSSEMNLASNSPREDVKVISKISSICSG